MDELTAFVAARLDDWEAGNQDRDDSGQCDWLDGWHFDPDAMGRIIASLRAILALHHPEWTDYRDGDGIERTSRECAECEPPGTPDNWPCPTMMALAAVWGDHPDYRQQWA